MYGQPLTDNKTIHDYYSLNASSSAMSDPGLAGSIHILRNENLRFRTPLTP